MRSLITWACVAWCLCLAFTSKLVAQQKALLQRKFERFLKEYDRDHSRAVTREEFEQRCEQRWQRWDKNGDNVVDLAEIEQGREAFNRRLARQNPFFQRFDRNNDGRVTKNELPRRGLRARVLRRLFKRLDKNRDGAVTMREAFNPKAKWVRQVQNKLHRAFFMKFDQNRNGVLEPDEVQDQTLFKLLDTDQNGQVSLQESKRVYTVQVLLKLDQNGDGQITRAEYDQMNQELFTRLDLDGDDTVTAQEVFALLKQGRNAANDEEDWMYDPSAEEPQPAQPDQGE